VGGYYCRYVCLDTAANDFNSYSFGVIDEESSLYIVELSYHFSH